MTLCVRVPKKDGEIVRSRLAAEGTLNLGARIRSDGDSLLIPVLCALFILARKYSSFIEEKLLTWINTIGKGNTP